MSKTRKGWGGKQFGDGETGDPRGAKGKLGALKYHLDFRFSVFKEGKN